MRFYYYPSCNFPKWFPETAPLLTEYMGKRFHTELLPCCHFAGKDFPLSATAVTVCLSCSLMVREHLGEEPEEPGKKAVHLAELMFRTK